MPYDVPCVKRSRRRSVARLVAVFAVCLAGCSGVVRPSTDSRGSLADAGASPTHARDAAADKSQGSGLRDSGVLLPFDDAGSDDTLAIMPAQRSLVIDSLAPKAVTFSLQRADGSPSALPVRWTLDRRELGTIDASSGEFQPSGVGGALTISAVSGSMTRALKLDVVVHLEQEGDPDSGKLQGGAGGLGGVGGDGAGAALPSGPLRAALDAAASDDPELSWLYPYDGTVWPRGLPAPLLQWQHGAHAPLAVKLTIEVDTSYRAEVYLGPPPALGAMQPIDRLPIPQAIWRNALQSGEDVTVSLVVAASSGGGAYQTYRAKNQLKWKVAPTALKGVVYYNSYGTKLAENFGGAQGGDGRFGGATLAITSGSFDPKLVAGTTTNDDSGCRVCHVVSADGSRLIVQRQDYASSSLYDLRNMNQEHPYPAQDRAKFGWSALSADGAIALGNAGPPGSTTVTASSLPVTALYSVADGTELTANGLSDVVTQAATPAFSPDMTKVAFNLFQGPSTSLPSDGSSIIVMDVSKVDDTTYDFTHPQLVYRAGEAGHSPCWPFFLPDNSGVVFELERSSANFGTWHGARGELWWSDLDGNAHALDRANGAGYLPTGPAGHDADSTLQYEPTVAPIVAGGYAWVVFTSRRLYGNVATRDPYESDPRTTDISPGNPAGPTTKKLWVTAISMPAQPGTDPSHPAFYLPAQELYAGNSRGYWALQACKEDKASCTAGDECCGGYCHLDAEFDVGVCSSTPPPTCSNEYDKCNVTADCCAAAVPLSCVAGRCAVIGLQ